MPIHKLGNYLYIFKSHKRKKKVKTLGYIPETALGVDIGDQTLTENIKYSKAIDGIMDCFVSRFRNIFWHNDFLFSWSFTKKTLNENLKVVHALSLKVSSLMFIQSLLGF